MNIVRACKIIAFISVLSGLGLVCATVLIIRGTARMEEFAQLRFDSIQLAQEVRATSSGLTASARAYVSSSNPAYEKHYWDLVKIRAGEMARPAGAQVAPGQTIALNKLLEDAGFTMQELDLLKESNRISATLVQLENEAMNAVKGRFKAPDGTYSVEGEPDPVMGGATYVRPGL